jgi:hypothetical protein
MLVLNANGTDKLTCITCWEECNTRTFQSIYRDWEPEIKEFKYRNPVILFSLLTGTQYTALLKNTDEDIELAIYQCTAFVYDSDTTWKQAQNNIIKLRDKIIMVPKKLGSLTIEQNMHIRRAMQTAKTLEELISLACAVYLQPLVEGKDFNYDSAMQLEKEILDLPIWQTYSVGFFFLSKLNRYGKSGLLDWFPNSLKQIWFERILPSLQRYKSSTPSMIYPSLTRMQKLTAFFRGL